MDLAYRGWLKDLNSDTQRRASVAQASTSVRTTSRSHSHHPFQIILLPICNNNAIL